VLANRGGSRIGEDRDKEGFANRGASTCAGFLKANDAFYGAAREARSPITDAEFRKGGKSHSGIRLLIYESHS